MILKGAYVICSIVNKMKILAIDTSSKVCSVAILENDKVIDELNLNDGKTHSENLMCLIDEILNKNNLNWLFRK